MLDIDGAHGEGGGQLVRTAVALAALSGRAVRVRNARGGRPKPGLAAQHATAIRAVAALCGARTEGVAAGSREFAFTPGPIRGGEFAFDVGTAGSVALVLQALMPVALAAPAPCRFRVTGGTDVTGAPPFDYLQHVLLPLLSGMGVRASLACARRGYFPRGGGDVRLEVAPRRPRPLRLEAPGAPLGVYAYAHVAGLPEAVLQRMVDAARATLGRALHLEERVLDAGAAAGPGGAIVLVARTEASLLAASAVAKRGVPAEALGRAAATELQAELAAGAAVDLHAADQLLIYLALAGGRSTVTARALSSHAATAIWLLEQFLPVKFAATAVGGLTRIDCRPA